jgi:hypothetical protein
MVIASANHRILAGKSGSALAPGMGDFQLAGQSQQGDFIGRPTHQLHPHRQAIRGKARGYGQGGLATGIEGGQGATQLIT